MCKRCFDTEYDGFDSEIDFVGFELELSKRLWKEPAFHLLQEGGEQDYSYICDECGEIWCLSVPENAWRGYFLKQKNRIDYKARIKKEDKAMKHGCLSFVFVFFIGIIALIYFILR